MGNNFKTCCSDTKDVTNELNRMEKEVDETVERSKANAKTYNAAPYIEKKSLEIFENPEISAIKNHLSDTPHDIKNINGNFISDSNIDAFRKVEFKPDEALISNFLVSRSHNKNINLENYICDKVNNTRSSRNVNENYNQDYTQTLNQPEFTGDNIVDLPAVYLDKERKNEIYMGSWIIDNKEIQEGKLLQNVPKGISFSRLIYPQNQSELIICGVKRRALLHSSYINDLIFEL